MTHINDLILPPSPNWFQHNAVSSRPEDRLFATACFRSIVIYKIMEEKVPPKLIKLISALPQKLTGVSFYPNYAHPEFGHTIAFVGEQSTLGLLDMHEGTLLAQHQVQKCQSLNSLCWGNVRDDDVVVGVGNKGCVVVWRPKYRVAKLFVLEQKKNLNVVEIVPSDRSQALVAADKTILLLSLQSGETLTQFKGHDNPIFCIRWYPGDKNPTNVDPLPANTRWKQDEEEKVSEEEMKRNGPFFASSDVGRTILLWDLTVTQYRTSTCAPVSTSMPKKQSKDRTPGKNNHITLNWANDKLYSSSVMGEIIEWNVSSSDPKFKLVTHGHSRAIYNMEVIDSILITVSQDRTIQGYNVATSTTHFTVPTLGVCPNSMAFSPTDANRLAIGTQESIELLTFNGKSPLTVKSIRQNIKGRVLSLSWHPCQEGKLLIGTSEGQVGFADVFSNKMTTFAYFHQKAAYKVEWAPPAAPQETGLSELWYAYSFGDRELLCHSASNVMLKPCRLDNFLGLEKTTSSNFCLTEFAFSPDYEYLALGSLSGEIKIHSRLTLKCLIRISRARKVIQHLLWKPPTSSNLPYILGIASGENSVFIFDLEEKLRESESAEEPLTLTQPKRELTTHVARVIWMSWSPHQDGILATSSYDRTVQIWNVHSGEPLKNYGGHNHRVFRAEFSPTDPDQVLSFAEENSVHMWRPSQLTSRTPSETTAILKEYRRKNKVESAEKEQAHEESILENGKCVNSTTSTSTSDSTISSTHTKKMSAPKKSSFPLFHNVSSKKKHFHHMCILSLMEEHLSTKKSLHSQNSEVLDDLEEMTESAPTEGIEGNVSIALDKYKPYMPPDQPLPEMDDVCFFLNFFGSVPQLDKVIGKEIKYHKENENLIRANLMHCWQGSLESHIKWAARHKQLDTFLVASAPQISFSLWEYACQAYADQLAESDDPITAATYLISIHKDEEAVNLLIKTKHYREALCIAKYRLGFNRNVIEKVINCWFSSSIFEGNFELACVLQICLGNIENGARALARKTEARSLVTAAQLYLSVNCTELAKSTAILAFKEASSKNEFTKFEPILKEMSDLLCCKCIHVCHQSILDHIALYNKNSPLPLPTMHAKTGNSEISDPEEESPIQPFLLDTVLCRWNMNGISPETFSKYLESIKEHFAEKGHPTSLKQLWFLVSICLSEMLLTGLGDCEGDHGWENCLYSALKCVEFWGKSDQIYYLTHLLLPNGIEDLSCLKIAVTGAFTAVNYLKELYISSETNLLISLLKGDKLYLPWREEKTVDEPCLQSVITENTLADAEITKIENTLSDAVNGVSAVECESGKLIKEDTVTASNTGPTKNIIEHRVTPSQEGTESCRYLLESKTAFLEAFETHIGHYIAHPPSNHKECLKALAELLCLLRERTTNIPSSLFTKLNIVDKQ